MNTVKHGFQLERLSIEVLIIVGSIFLAFSIEAWWSERRARDSEVIVLQSILDDLIIKQQVLEEDKAFNQALLDSTTRLLQLAASGSREIETAELDRIMGVTWWYNNKSRLDSAPLTSLFSGGGTAQISNTALIQKLAELQVIFTLIKDQYANDENFHHNTLTPFYISHVSLAQLAMIIDYVPGLPETPYYFPEIDIANPADHTDLLSSLEFQSMLTAKIDRQLDIIRGGYDENEVDRVLAEAIDMLEAELQ